MTVFDEVYSGVGVTKLDAKMNAAVNAVDALQRNGVIAAREEELRAERREANWLKQHAEGPPEIPRYDQRMFGRLDFTILLSEWVSISDIHVDVYYAVISE